MTRKLTRISVRSVARIAAVLHFVIGVVLAIAGAIALWLAPGPITSMSFGGPLKVGFDGAPPTVAFILSPFLSAASGAAISALLAWLYNLLVPHVGAIELTLEE